MDDKHYNNGAKKPFLNLDKNSEKGEVDREPLLLMCLDSHGLELSTALVVSATSSVFCSDLGGVLLYKFSMP